MALSRNARRKLAKQRKVNRLHRLAKAEIGRRQDEVRQIVNRNLSGPKPERTPAGLTQNYASFESSSVSPKKHCEAKQVVTVYGRNQRCIPKR